MIGKTLFLVTGLSYGGAEIQLVQLATRLKARGWDVMVVSLTPPKAYREDLEAAGVSVVSLNIRRKLPDPRPVLRLARLIRSWHPEIIHGFMVHANILARLVRPIAPIPVLICSARNIDEGGRVREFLYRLTDPLCEITTQVSLTGLKRYVQVGAVPSNKILNIPNGVDIERFRPDPGTRKRLRKELSVEESFVWLAVGRFFAQKDYPNMLSAFSRVIRDRPEAVLIIVGDGPLRRAMEELAGNLSLKDRIRLIGIHRDIPALMNAADAYVISSAWEGMANVLLEASATGLPVVATDVGGNSEVVQDNKTGLLVPPKDPEELAKAMIRLMDLSSEERRQMGAAGRAYIESTYSMDRIVDMWEVLYRKLLSEKATARKVH